MLTPYLPFPPSSGGQIRSFNLLKHLSKKHEITLFSLIKDDAEKEYVGELKKYCKKIFVFKRSRSPWTLRNILLTGFGPYPFLVIRNLAPIERRSVEEELKKEKYDLIHAETFYVMPHLPITKTPVLLVEQTIEYLVYKHYVESVKSAAVRALLGIDVAKLKYWERAYWRKADKVVAVSSADKKEMVKLVPELNVSLVPNGVNLEFFQMKKKWDMDEPRILFVANFKWLQNAEAAELLLNEVFPLIRKKVPKAKLWIVGQHIPEKIAAHTSGGVIVDNLKENDEESIKNAYFNASVFVSPLRGPGGTRLKHFAAMASKLPLITTKVGAEGLGVRDGEEVIIRNTPKEIAEETIRLLKNPKLSQMMAEKARILVAEKFSWEKMAESLDKLYQETANDKNS